MCDHNKMKRWQYGTRGIMLLTGLVAAPLICLNIVRQIPSEYYYFKYHFNALAIYAAAICMFGGVMGATTCWFIYGTKLGFITGYFLGIFVTFVLFVQWFWILL